ncbi:protein phosphatase 1 regulatory inhibitor subunit PPP1R8 homolog [Corylus avellana]|uniref:protein phosphatase 1 regulatory inhibitor subunit PPP1R8 homolog n=1 Tax=Corylus avellana TaxID=13451 RepID=UPI001E233F14|nr:protein phosphatase 1 regulatory inhibitor subunit PPP1R8 homolog [Corylus avellana]
MYGRAGLDRFKKAQSLEPFSVAPNNSAPKTNTQLAPKASQQHQEVHVSQEVGQTQPVTQVGGGQSTWQPPEWAIEPRPGVYYLEVLKDGEVLDKIILDRRRNIFGRQFPTCDFVLEHNSVSRQHAAVIPHKNGSIYVMDLGSAHGTFVANERLTKDSPVELEVGQSLRFAASTRTYILRKNEAALFPRPPLPAEIDLQPPPDPSDEEAVVAYNTLVNRYGLSKPDRVPKLTESGRSKGGRDNSQQSERLAKRLKKLRVSFRDQFGGELVEVVGVSDGADVETEPGPLGVKEGSLVGKYEHLVQVTVIPKGKQQSSAKEDTTTSQKGVTDKLQEVLNRVKTTPKSGIYDDLYGESFSVKVGSSWAYPDGKPAYPTKDTHGKMSSGNSSNVDDVSDDDLFGD